MQRQTWNDLKAKIEAMTDEQRNTDVTLFDDNDGEFCRLLFLSFTNKNDDNGDVLDDNHPYLHGMN